jgi:protein SCO1/2
LLGVRAAAKGTMMNHFGRFASLAALAVFTTTAVSGCGSKPGAQRYALRGEIISLTPGGTSVSVKHGDIPGYMPAMTMSYPLADPKEARDLHAGDKITADLIVGNGRAELAKIVVTEKTKHASAEPEASKP